MDTAMFEIFAVECLMLICAVVDKAGRDYRSVGFLFGGLGRGVII